MVGFDEAIQRTLVRLDSRNASRLELFLNFLLITAGRIGILVSHVLEK